MTVPGTKGCEVWKGDASIDIKPYYTCEIERGPSRDDIDATYKRWVTRIGESLGSDWESRRPTSKPVRLIEAEFYNDAKSVEIYIYLVWALAGPHLV